MINGGIRQRNFTFHSAPEDDKKMFREEYCKQVDDMLIQGFVDNDDLELRMILKKIPCGLEFMKYVSWHMFADRMKRESDSMTFGVSNDGSSLSAVTGNSLTIYYEDYAEPSKTNAVVTMMADFLDLGTVDYNQRPSFAGEEGLIRIISLCRKGMRLDNCLGLCLRMIRVLGIY